MVASKRAPPSSPAKAAKVSKAGKVIEASVSTPEFCKPAMELLDAVAGGLPSAATDMFRSALPFALAGEGERHRYQNQVLAALGTAASEEEARRCGVVQQFEAKLTETEDHKQTAQSQAQTEAACEAAAREERAQKTAAMKEAQQTVEAAKSSLDVQRQQSTEAGQRAEAAVGARDLYLKSVADNFEALKAGPCHRAKAMERLLTEAAAPQSMVVALPMVAKQRPEVRSDFGRQVVEHAEAMLQARVAELTRRCEEGEAAVEGQAQAVQAAEEDVRGAEAALEAMTQAWIEAENAWVEAEGRVQALNRTLQELSNEHSKLTSGLAAARSSLEALRELKAAFEALRTPTVVATALFEEPAPAPQPEAASEEQVAAALLA